MERNGGEGFQGRFECLLMGWIHVTAPRRYLQVAYYTKFRVRVIATRVFDIEMSIVRAPRCHWMIDTMYL